MSSPEPRDAAGVIERACCDDLLLSAPVRRNLTARQQRAAMAYIERRQRASRPPPMAAVNLTRDKVDSSLRVYEPLVPHDDMKRFRELVAALPNDATRRVLADVLDGVGMTESGRRLARAHRAAWMPSARNESECIMVVKVLLAVGLDCIANTLCLPP